MLPIGLFKELTEYGEKVHNMTATETDFMNIQRFIAHIQECYDEDIIKDRERQALNQFAFLVRDEMRRALR